MNTQTPGPIDTLHESTLGPDAGSLDPTDGREINDWKSRYPQEAKSQIRHEAWYIFVIFAASLVLILLTWQDVLAQILSVSQENNSILQRYAYYCFAGLLGATVYSMKYLYRVVARGWWHEDRKLWRYMSPFIGLALSFIIGCLIESKFVPLGTKSSAAAIIGVGFLVGYFADQAIGKLHDIADVIFGPTGTKRPSAQHK
ncbi:MAG: hypothetical protein HY850_10570 [Betaproteobacteria bacterium]|nr:hypothetical protein [Betaproteobacteria bacterium]